MKALKRYFLTGLLVLLPISLSIWILMQVVLFLENILAPFFKNILEETYRFGLGAVSLVLIILLVGFLASNILGRRLIDRFHRGFERLPLFNRVYLMIKGISESVLGDNKRFFDGVALVPFPSENTRTIGFITAVSTGLEEKYIGVFVPTTPNITTGFYLMFPRADVEILDMSVEDGLKQVLSFGITSRQKSEAPGPENPAGKNNAPE